MKQPAQTKQPALTFALPKGRLLEPTLEFLRKAGIPTRGLASDRRLLVERRLNTGQPEGSAEASSTSAETVRFLLVRSSDVSRYVARGVAEIGIVGKDILLEEKPAVYEVEDLGYGTGRLVVAGLEDRAGWQRPPVPLRVATSFPNITREFFENQGLETEVIQLRGSVELAPLVDLADAIVDITSTGRTLAENGLVEWKEIRAISARLVVNPSALDRGHSGVHRFIRAVKQEEGAVSWLG